MHSILEDLSHREVFGQYKFHRIFRDRFQDLEIVCVTFAVEIECWRDIGGGRLGGFDSMWNQLWSY